MDEAALPTKDRPSLAQVALVPATLDHQPILANLLQFYIYDFSEIMPLELGADARFAYPEFPRYWSDPSRFPFLAAVDRRWAGLVFIKQVQVPERDGPVWDMAEFFVMRGYRRHGVGTRLAHLAFRRFPGKWQVRVMESNFAARYFWERTIEEFTGTVPDSLRMNLNGAFRHIFRFESKTGLSRGPDTLIPTRG